MITGAEVDDKFRCEGHSKPQIIGVLHCRLGVNARRLEVLFDKLRYTAATSFNSIFTQADVTWDEERIIRVFFFHPFLCQDDDVSTDGVDVSYNLFKRVGFRYTRSVKRVDKWTLLGPAWVIGRCLPVGGQC